MKIAIALFLFLFILFAPALSFTLKPGDFLVYNETSYIYYPKYLVDNMVIVQQINDVFNNGTFLVNSTIIALSQNSSLPSVISLQNESTYGDFYYVNPQTLGKNISQSLIFNGTRNGLYEYYTVTFLDGVENKLVIYFNSSGVVVKQVDYQISEGKIVSESITTLWKDNLFANDTLPTFHVAHKKPLTVNLGSYESLPQKLIKIIAIVGLVIILAILLFRRS